MQRTCGKNWCDSPYVVSTIACRGAGATIPEGSRATGRLAGGPGGDPTLAGESRDLPESRFAADDDTHRRRENARRPKQSKPKRPPFPSY